VALNAGHEPIELWVPSCGIDSHWQVMLDTDQPQRTSELTLVNAGDRLAIAARSLLAMLCRAGATPAARS
jgi:hypothetical protein